MISTNSIRVYITLNAALVGLSYLYYFALQSGLLNLIAFTGIRNIILTKAIESSTSVKPFANNNHIEPRGEYIYYILQTSALEAVATYVIVPLNTNPNYYSVALAYIPMSFLFMVIFDLFFYGVHRFLHKTHSIWHKQHHENIHLKPALTFYQDSIDIILSIVIPFIITTNIVQIFYPLSSFELALLATYKSFIEISGHSGRVSNPSCCFPQFIWLPKLLGIEQYSEDHALHHTNPNVNFSKQFTLWDKAFGTYQKPN
jgi:sterol desaturase/sphingolipid hydroxylase (fatty acid hydroxylase superfamily)